MTPKIITRNQFSDDRGRFGRIHCKSFEQDYVGFKGVAQVNLSVTGEPGVIRGLHIQRYPNNEFKVVSCIRGKIFDVAVCVDPNSPEFGRKFCFEISEQKNESVLVPHGYAHGFQSLEPNSTVLYLVDRPYSQEDEICINPFDDTLSIEWPLNCTSISAKDAAGIKLVDVSLG